MKQFTIHMWNQSSRGPSKTPLKARWWRHFQRCLPIRLSNRPSISSSLVHCTATAESKRGSVPHYPEHGLFWRSWLDHPIFDHGLIIVMGPGELRGGWEQQDEAPAGDMIIILTANIPFCWQIIFCIVCNCIVFVSTWACNCTENKRRLRQVERSSFWSYLWHWPAIIPQLFLFADKTIFDIVCYFHCFFVLISVWTLHLLLNCICINL